MKWIAIILLFTLRVPMDNSIERVREVIRKGNHTGKNLEAYNGGLNRNIRSNI